MTYNQVIKRIKTIALAHKQVRYFGRGLIQDFLTDKTIPYAAVFLEDGGASINPGQNSASFSFRIRFVDLVHVSENTKENELDVLSDMFSVAMDIIAQLNYPGYNDWAISLTNNMQRLVEEDGDMYAGWYLDFLVRIMYDQNVCEIPTTIPGYEPGPDDDMKLVYYVQYIADGSEESVLNVPEIVGKYLILATREDRPMYRVSNLPSSDEYVWNDVFVALGLPTLPNERFWFIYRSY